MTQLRLGAKSRYHRNLCRSFTRPIRQAGIVVGLSALLAGCAGNAGLPFGSAADSGTSSGSVRFAAIQLPSQQGPLAEPTQRGLDAISRGDYRAANQGFSAALNRDSRNPALHAMNALAYHLRVRNGERDLLELAETGYLVSLEQRRDFLPSALQLAHLYFEHGRYQQAKRAAIYALDIESDNINALQLLAASAYHDGDMELALWAVEAARQLAPGDRWAATMQPVIYSAAGLNAEAERALQRNHADGLLDGNREQRTRRRIGQWREVYQLAQASPPPARSLPADMPPGAAAGSPQTATPVAPPGSPVSFAPVAAPAASATAPPKEEGPFNYAWWDCQQQLNASATPASSSYGGSSAYGGGYGSSSADETSVLPALPAPCRGRALPRMTMIDAVLLRTDDVRSSGYGVNLLDNLSVFLNNSINTTRSWGTTGHTRTTTVTQFAGLGTTAGGGIAYSLNIANASDQRAEILARPSLLALDRQAAQFFSGSTVSVALVSNEGGGNLQDKPVGVSLSVTPTFIDDDSMLVSVKAVRSFFEETAQTATFAQSVQTSRNMVTANVRLRFNETLILSGLSEREITNTGSRTPVLGDLPGLQYLFSRRDSQDFTRSVIILLTPRRVANFSDTLLQAGPHTHAETAQDPALVAETKARALKELGGTWPNLSITLRHMDRNRLFRAVRSGDIELEDWQQANRIRRMLGDFVDLLYQ